MDLLGRLVLDLLVVAEECVFNLLARDGGENARVARSGLVLSGQRDRVTWMEVRMVHPHPTAHNLKVSDKPRESNVLSADRLLLPLLVLCLVVDKDEVLVGMLVRAPDDSKGFVGHCVWVCGG